MSYFPPLSNPVRPKFQASYTLVPGNQVKTIQHMNWVDLGGVEPPSKQLLLRHAKILVVNVLGISQNIRFKAIFSLSDAFSTLLWVAIPLKHIKRLESLKTSLEKVYCLATDSKILGEIYRIFETVIQRFYIIHAGSMAQYNSWFLI